MVSGTSSELNSKQDDQATLGESDPTPMTWKGFFADMGLTLTHDEGRYFTVSRTKSPAARMKVMQAIVDKAKSMGLEAELEKQGNTYWGCVITGDTGKRSNWGLGGKIGIEFFPQYGELTVGIESAESGNYKFGANYPELADLPRGAYSE